MPAPKQSPAPRETDAYDRLAIAPPPPARLSKDAANAWTQIMPSLIALGVLRGVDLLAAEHLAWLLAMVRRAEETLEVEGLTVPTGTGSVKANPAIRILERARTEALRMLSSFGMTPAGRKGLDVRPPLDDPNRVTAALFPR